MKMLLVAAQEDHAATLSYHLKPLGFELERMANPVKALEQIDEIDPQAILFNAADFPRHWKALLKIVREKKKKEELVFILVAPPGFEIEEAAKASHLGVNGIMSPNLSDKKELYRLEELLRRYRELRDKRSFARIIPTDEDNLAFAFTNPLRLSLVVGKIREISIQGMSFFPSPASAVAELAVGHEIRDCSLKIGGETISVTCRLTRNRRELGFQFLTFEEGGHHKLLKFIQERSERALKMALLGKK
jgi:hypothetical protein